MKEDEVDREMRRSSTERHKTVLDAEKKKEKRKNPGPRRRGSLEPGRRAPKKHEPQGSSGRESGAKVCYHLEAAEGLDMRRLESGRSRDWDEDCSC